MKKVLISTTEDGHQHGFKARYDIIDALLKDGFKEYCINTYPTNSMKNLLIDLYKNKKELKKILKETKNSIIAIQYPWNSMSYSYAKMIKKYCNKNNNKSVAIIHDLNSIRSENTFGRLYYNHVVKEFKFLNKFDYVICHNYKMKEMLLDKEVTNPTIIELKLFDYLHDTTNKIDTNDYKVINIAGNLSTEKAGYVYNLNKLIIKNYKVELYGKYSGDTSKNINYNGSFTPEELITHLNKGFGLIWDGDSITTCSGKYGEYLKKNNPHKSSLYMACGIPVIVWKESALAKFVIDNKVGIAIDSLEELDDIFNNMNKKEYEELLKNVKKINKKVIKGDYIISAIKKIK